MRAFVYAVLLLATSLSPAESQVDTSIYSPLMRPTPSPLDTVGKILELQSLQKQIEIQQQQIEMQELELQHRRFEQAQREMMRQQAERCRLGYERHDAAAVGTNCR